MCKRHPKKAVSLIKTPIYECEFPRGSNEYKLFASNDLSERCFQNEFGFVILCLQAGYLTQCPTGTVGIPNQELLSVFTMDKDKTEYEIKTTR